MTEAQAAERPEATGELGAIGVWVAAYSAVLAAAELVGFIGGGMATAFIDAALVSALLVYLYVWSDDSNREILPVLALVALIPVVGIAAVVPSAPRLSWYVLTGAPLLAGAILAMRVIDAPVGRLHLHIACPALDLLVVDAGAPLGVLGYALLRPQPLLERPAGPELVAAALVLVICGGLVEELIFRGLLLAVSEKLIGRRGPAILYVAAINVTLYLGSGSIAYALLIGGAGVIYGAALARGASIWSVSASHGLLLVSMASLALR
jgi:membrane protease YdiL (CAAX protease family)